MDSLHAVRLDGYERWTNAPICSGGSQRPCAIYLSSGWNNQCELPHILPSLSILQTNGFIEKQGDHSNATYQITRQIRVDWVDVEDLLEQEEKANPPLLGIFRGGITSLSTVNTAYPRIGRYRCSIDRLASIHSRRLVTSLF